jgi:type I restriction enzyme S subunit
VVSNEFYQTDIGKIPAGWQPHKVGELVSFSGGSQPNKNTFKFRSCAGYIRLIQIRDYKSDKYETYIPESLARKTCDENDVMIGRYGPPIFQILRGIKGAYNVALIKASPCEKLDKEFFYHFIKNENLFSLMDALSRRSSGQTGVDLPALREYPLPLPNTEEQTAIANSLSDVDVLITSLEKLITKKRAIKTAAMQQLLTGKKRLPGFEGDWSIISMNTHATLKARIGWQALTTNEYLDQGDFYLVTGTDFKGGRVDWSTCHYVDEWRYSQDRNIQLQNGDVLLTKDGTIGKVGYVDKLGAPATLNSGVFVIRPVKESFYPLFLFYILSSRIFDNFLNRITAGSTITHLYQKDFVTFEFFAPSLTEQEAISEILSTMDDEIELLQYRLHKTQQLKQGMMQELLTGRTRLI